MAMAASSNVGPWAVSVDWQNAHVEDTRNDEVFTASVTRSAEGYELAEVWTNGLADCTADIPAKVKSKARALVATLG
ncbi:hypothetical protein PXH69_21875 [Rhodococcus qingshengii]|uniref:Uncharacterized protein n=1 Tax=Rhodococcus qingshengii TaxID=334542 RepID=A0AAW6LKA5_RHOSG|nr:hypothetical protein [Rhodococcus qingshengii]MDE8647628.1 hypothetical protein [Rhodococcus qingshengii]